MNTEMKELRYRGYTIVVRPISNNIGTGFCVSFYTGALPGENHQAYETYRRKTYAEAVSDVEKIIDALG